eukprot:3824114-Amphidinium_carterae.1
MQRLALTCEEVAKLNSPPCSWMVRCNSRSRSATTTTRNDDGCAAAGDMLVRCAAAGSSSWSDGLSSHGVNHACSDV